MKIQTKLFSGFAIVAIIGVFLGLIGLYGDHKLTTSTKEMLKLANGSSSLSAILSSHFEFRHDLVQHVFIGEPFTSALDPKLCSLGRWLASDEVKSITDPQILAILSSIVGPHELIHNMARDIVGHIANGNHDLAVSILDNEVIPTTQIVINYLKSINGRYDDLLYTENYGAIDLGNRFSVIIIISIIVALIFAAVLGILIALNILRPIAKVTSTLKDISEGEGDLTQRINSEANDEIAHLSHYFDLTLEKIKNLVVNIKQEANLLSEIGITLSSNTSETAAAINQINANIQSVKSHMENQSASVTETTATMEQVSGNINKLNSHIEDQSNHISQASAAIEEMVANIHSVTDTLEKNASNVKTLKSTSEDGRTVLQDVATDIGTIARESEDLMEINVVIENIASQTNLLSMNAAIEAAHAGEAGKGFAVVADEIRKLAESSSSQSRTISAVLKRMKESMEKITESTQKVLTKFEDIDSGVKNVAEHEENILIAMQEQGHGSRQVLQGIGLVIETTASVKTGSSAMLEGSKEVIVEGRNLEKVTEEITFGMNEMASGAEQINTAANEVNQISMKNRQSIEALVKEVSRFKVQ